MTAKKKYGRFEVRCTEGGDAWFKLFDKAEEYFAELVEGLKEDMQGLGETAVVELINIKTGDVIRKQEIEG